MILLLLFFAFLGARDVKAQTNAQTVYVTVAPSGSCQARANLRLVVPNGTLYTCQSGTWAIASGSGGSCATLAGDVIGSCAANKVVKINNGAVPANALTLGTNSSNQPIAGPTTTTVNGQTCTLSSTCDANSGAANNTLALNSGAGAAIGGLLLSAHQTVVGVAGVPTAKTITDCTDTAGQHINYTQSTDSWSCGTSNGTSTTANWVGFTSQTSVTNTHNLGTNDLFLGCWDGSNNSIGFSANNTSVNVTVFTFTNAQTGRCGVTTGGNGSGGGGGGGSVNSVTASAPVASSGGANPNITIVNFTGDSGSGGANGAVPAPASGDAAAGKILGASGGFILPGMSTTIIVKGNGGHNGGGTVASTEFFSTCDTSGGAFSLLLPVSPVTGELHNIKKIDSSANACTIDGNGKTIDGNATMPIVTSMAGFSVYYTGTVWYIIGII